MSTNHSGLRFVKPVAPGDPLPDDPLGHRFVWWGDLSIDDVDAYRRALGAATVEADLQQYLQEHPQLLVQYLGGGHGRWVLPQPRLGSQHVPDFVIGDQDSAGRSWIAVELEGPQQRMFNRDGEPSRWLWHAIRQIIDWRVWLEFNRDYAARAPADGGLGLVDISPSLPGLIVIGRQADLDDRRSAFRRGLSRQLNVEIHSYDWLADRAEGVVKSLESSRRGR
jgi:hypothetical protein